MANATPSTLEILIDIRARLDAIAQVQAGMRGVAEDTRDAHEEANSLAGLFRQGLGIGSGMELAWRAVDLFRDSFTQAVRISSQLAAEVERAHGRLNLSAEAYQTLAAEARGAETEFSEIMGSLAQYRAMLGDTLLDPTKGTVLRTLGQDAQQLAAVGLERQLETLAIALGGVADENVRARLTQELFGRGAAAITPLLERLRTEGYDRLRESARETNAILGDGTADALNRAGNRMEEAQKRLGVALAPVNLRLIEAQTQVVNFLARNAGPITSGVEASFAAAFASALVTGVEKGVASVEKMGGWRAAFSKLGDLMAGPFGVALITAVGGVLIKEIERRSLESIARQDAMFAAAHRRPAEVRSALPRVENEDQVNGLYKRAVEANNAAIKTRNELLRTPVHAMDDDQRAQLQALEQELDQWQRLIPIIRQKGREAIAANAASKVQFDEIKKAQTDLLVIEANHANFQASEFHTAEQLLAHGIRRSTVERENREEETKFLSEKATLLERIISLSQKLPLGSGETEEDRQRELNKLRAEVAASKVQFRNTNQPLSDAARLENQFANFRAGENADGSQRLTMGQGAEAGAQSFVMSLGTQGEQVAAAMQSSIGATVQGISDGIFGWITGAQTFGDTLRGLGSTLLQTFLDTIVQMGVQWVINAALAKGSLISTFMIAAGLRKAETADVIANETAKTPSIMANAAGSSVSSFGLAAVLGIAALVAVMAAFGGFRERGGDVQAGRAYVVGEKRPEVFVPDQPGRIIPSLDEMPVPPPARARSVSAPAPVAASGAFAASAAGAAQQKRERIIAVVPPQTMKQMLRDDPDAENVIADVVYRRRGDILG